MIIKKLRQNNFRNIKDTQIEFSPGVNLIIGDNGQGKTNILEALYLTLSGHSFRPAKSEHFINRTQDQGFIEVNVENKNFSDRVKIEFQNNSKKSFVNGKRNSSQNIQAQFPLVLFSPESLSAVKEGPELRRNLVDDLLISHNPQNANLLAEFSKCLKSRNRLLKDHLKEVISTKEFLDVLSSLDQSYLPLAAKLTSERISALRNIKSDFAKATSYILNLNNVEITLNYIISSQAAFDWKDKDVYYALLKRRDELQSAEKESGTTLFGPQRHDIQFLFDQEDARYYCSQGQQRALILAFKMAQMMYHYRVHKSYPVLLLDDVMSELDPAKRNFLISFLKQLDAQIILTTTDLEFPIAFGKEKLTIFKVKQGVVDKDGE
ncbi:MAG: DNA replication and repair protein RecF [Bdellovibrionales bacterium]|nr:DNA replication and repair protein RecF [Bdellovibrionales bacterium]